MVQLCILVYMLARCSATAMAFEDFFREEKADLKVTKKKRGSCRSNFYFYLRKFCWMSEEPSCIFKPREQGAFYKG
jgi:hypothetical protein